MFLTAFVVRTLTEAKPYIFIDDGILSKSVGWILEHQTQNGSFPPLNHLFQHLVLLTLSFLFAHNNYFTLGR